MKFKPRKRRRSALPFFVVFLAVFGVVFKFGYLERQPNAPLIAAVRDSQLQYTLGPIEDIDSPIVSTSEVEATLQNVDATPPAIVPRDNPEAPAEQTIATKENAPVPVEPAQYKDAGFFEGGKVENGLVLTGIRFGKHPDFRRVVIEFGIPDRDNPGKTIPPAVHPKYKVEYRSCPYRFTITFAGVGSLDDTYVQKKDALPFSLVSNKDGNVKQLEIFITKPAMFKVIEVDDPARLAIDIKYKTDVEVPIVNVVQVIGIDSVERAFELIETNRFPESFKPQIVVIGDKFFVEGIYDTFDQAITVSSELEKLNFSTIISERKGSAFPVDD
jgi:hypothetical protein